MLGSKSKSLAAAICKRYDVNILAAMPRETEPKGLKCGMRKVKCVMETVER